MEFIRLRHRNMDIRKLQRGSIEATLQLHNARNKAGKRTGYADY